MPTNRIPENFSVFAFEIEGFRAFKERARIEFAPVTLLYGRNQAGKSTLLRLLPALADAIFGTTPLLNINTQSLHGASFRELGWLGPEPITSPSIKIEAGKNKSFCEIQFSDDKGIIANRISIGRGSTTLFEALFVGSQKRSADTFSAEYEGSWKRSDWKGEITFKSFLPTGLPENIQDIISEIYQGLKNLKHIQWLATNKKTHENAPQKTQCCAADGSNLPQILAEKKDLLSSINEWLLKEACLEESLSIGWDPVDRRARFELRKERYEALPNHLSGEGMQWLLPIIGSACWAESNAEGAPCMLAIEEPEARLHPSLQITLFDRLIKSAKAGIPIILETHSIYILRAIQLALAKKSITPTEVAIYWIEASLHGASVRAIPTLEDGTLTNWNPETFEEEQQLARQIFEARWEGSRDN